jgi:DNA segregation ATPase FtsK/SpoIIIE, S-DNA-T family
VRTYLADAADAEKILHAARALRERAGILSGHAAGETSLRECPRRARRHPRAVFAAGESGLHWTQIAARLAERIPEHSLPRRHPPRTRSAHSCARSACPASMSNATVVLKGSKAAAIAEAIARRDTANWGADR